MLREICILGAIALLVMAGIWALAAAMGSELALAPQGAVDIDEPLDIDEGHLVIHGRWGEGLILELDCDGVQLWRHEDAGVVTWRLCVQGECVEREAE